MAPGLHDFNPVPVNFEREQLSHNIHSLGELTRLGIVVHNGKIDGDTD